MDTSEKGVDAMKELINNRLPNENEHKCKNCGNVQSKSIHRCLKCAKLIMHCNKCGTEISESQKFCPNCGEKVLNEALQIAE